MKNSDVIKECRAAAKRHGLTFKEMDYSDSEKLYKYVIRKTGVPIRSYITLSTAYEMACSGELAKYIWSK